ncbi:MAG: carbamoyl-phosphate synthase large subunit, partial [Rhodospirillales bacterium]
RGAEPVLTTSMKSVGEVMAIGRTFAESLQKALRSMETGLTGLNEVAIDGVEPGQPFDVNRVRAALANPSPDRLLLVAQAMRLGFTHEEIRRVTFYDPWFLDQIAAIIAAEDAVRRHGLPADAAGFHRLKRMGFSDARLAELVGGVGPVIARRRRQLGVRPVYKRIDTCAAEFASQTPYMYSTYEGDGLAPAECESAPTDRRKVMILGGGPNRIGQGIEFDYCCVHAVYALREAGYETIMVNCNPETVSTDYDTADRLYFEPLTAEDVIEIAAVESSRGTLLGVILQFGGQTPLKLAAALEGAGIPILGTPPDAIDLAEDRRRFQEMLSRLDLRQPRSGTATTEAEAAKVAEEIGYPVLIRPSYVLGGRAMEIAHDPAAMQRYVREAVLVSGRNPVLIDSYLRDAIEVDVDALADTAGAVFVCGVMEHIEEAGIHSGDSACSLPPYSLPPAIVDEIRRQTVVLAKALGVVGLMNVQFAVKDHDIYILEVNPRASRTVPFVAKATGMPIAKMAARIMLGELLPDLRRAFDAAPARAHIAVKEAVFPFNRFPGVDIILGPEMRSTGEVMGIDDDFGRAFAKSQLASGATIPSGGCVFISVKDSDKPAMIALGRRLAGLGFTIVATRGTARTLHDAGIEAGIVNKVLEGRPNVVDSMKNGEIQLVFNTTEGAQATADSFSLRRTALLSRIPYYTTVAGARAAVEGIAALKAGSLDVTPLQSYFKGSF